MWLEVFLNGIQISFANFLDVEGCIITWFKEDGKNSSDAILKTFLYHLPWQQTASLIYFCRRALAAVYKGSFVAKGSTKDVITPLVPKSCVEENRPEFAVWIKKIEAVPLCRDRHLVKYWGGGGGWQAYFFIR